ncbi:hypothetical protein ACP275_08G120300 [Erythranthe tilingii]
MSHRPPPPPPLVTVIDNGFSSSAANVLPLPRKDSSDLVSLKISLFGDSHIGKTSFLTQYAGREKGEEELGVTGINHVDKTLYIKGARITCSIWEVRAACKDSVAMLFMFDLTSRRTLNSVIRWYQEARKCNQTAIPVLIGTKFDDFIQLPIDMQWTIASEARAYAKALNATLTNGMKNGMNKSFAVDQAEANPEVESVFNNHW